jgi:hypothetical protein
MEETQTRVKQSVDTLIDDFDKSYLRDIQKVMFQCSAKCCEDKRGSRRAIEECVERCNVPMQAAQTGLERELNSLQDQLSRCTMTVSCLRPFLLQFVFSATTSLSNKWGPMSTSIRKVNWEFSKPS